MKYMIFGKATIRISERFLDGRVNQSEISKNPHDLINAGIYDREELYCFLEIFCTYESMK